MKPVFAWAIRRPDGSLLFDPITGAPWLASHGGHSASDLEVAIIPRMLWETLSRQVMSDTLAVLAAPDLPDPIQTPLVPNILAWANDVRIRISVQPILTDDGVLAALGLRIGASAGWTKAPDEMLLLSAEIDPFQLRMAINPDAFARQAIDTAVRAVLDALRDAYTPPAAPALILTP